MKSIFKIIILLHVCGVFGYEDEVKSVSVYEGDCVTLHTGAVIPWRHNGDIRWNFKNGFSLVYRYHQPKIIVNNTTYSDFALKTFKNRLHISERTGDLTIRNIRIKHTGLYEAEIRIYRLDIKRFSVVVKESPHVINAETSNVNSVSVMEGESVTLQTDVQIQKGDLIVWRFGSDGDLIARGDMEDEKRNYRNYEDLEYNEDYVYKDTRISYIDSDWRFRDRLKLSDQTGNLIISDITTENTGLYELKISSNSREILHKTFNVTVRGQWFSGAYLGIITGIGVSLLLFVPPAAVALMVYFYCKISKVKRQMVKKKTGMEGDSVTLYTDLTKLKTDDVIKWRFRDQEIIAEINRKDHTFSTYDGDDGRFKNRLYLKYQTGDLTITNIRTDHSGFYELKIISSKGTSWSQFSVTVTDT
nr:uncharacterized protein LOC129453131 isoform X1 [Misgurnus anguillicaudatus]